MNHFFLLITLIGLLGCAQPNKMFYVLTPSGHLPSVGGVGIGVGPVILAEYLNRPNLVTQQGPNQLAVAEDHRWAGELGGAIARVTATNLGRILKTGNVRTYPWPSDGEIRYQVTLDVRQLHSDAEGYALIEAGWRVYSLPDRRLKISRNFVDREPLISDGYASMVAAESKLLERMADTMAVDLR